VSTAEDIHCNGTCVKSTRIVDMALYTDKDITKTAMTLHEMIKPKIKLINSCLSCLGNAYNKSAWIGHRNWFTIDEHV
jgi:hypothetical protein